MYCEASTSWFPVHQRRNTFRTSEHSFNVYLNMACWSIQWNACSKRKKWTFWVIQSVPKVFVLTSPEYRQSGHFQFHVTRSHSISLWGSRVNYYHCFVPQWAEILAPLHQVLATDSFHIDHKVATGIWPGQTNPVQFCPVGPSTA